MKRLLILIALGMVSCTSRQLQPLAVVDDITIYRIDKATMTTMVNDSFPYLRIGKGYTPLTFVDGKTVYVVGDSWATPSRSQRDIHKALCAYNASVHP